MLKFFKRMVCLVVILMPATLWAAVEVEHILDTKIGAPILDVATDHEEELIFFLTPGSVLIYSSDTQTVLDRIPVEKAFNRIAYQADDKLVLAEGNSQRISIIRFSRIYEIDTSGRAVKGPADAKVTLAVFDDYQ